VSAPTREIKRPIAAARAETAPEAFPASGGGRLPARYRLRQLASVCLGLVLFAGALWVLARWARHVTLEQLWAELVAIGSTRVALAVLFTALSFCALVGYEVYAVLYTGRRLPLAVVALYSFITQGIAHATGFAIFVGASVRYRLYGARGFHLLDVITIQVYFSTTFGLALATLVGLALGLDPEPLARAVGTGTLPWQLAGAILVAGVAVVVFLSAVLHRRVRVFGHPVDLPDLRTSLFLLALGVGDLLGVAATLHVLLPPELGLSFFQTLAIFVAAIGLGLVSHVPGSLGVFEGAVVLLVDAPQELAAPLLGALIAFRAIYYVLPLVLALLAWGGVELARLLARRADTTARRGDLRS